MANQPEPLGFTVHSLPQPDAAGMPQRASGRIKMLLVLLVCAAPVLASYYTYFIARPSGGTAYGTLIQPAVPMPDVAVLTLAGQPQPLRGLAGQWLLVVVDGGACGPTCEKHLFVQRQLREMAGRESDRIDKLWLVIDDTPLSPSLQAALLATPAMNIVRLPRAVVSGWLKAAPGQALEDHLYIVDPVGDWMMRAPADADPSKLKRDVDRLLRGSAGWDKAGRQALIVGPTAAVTQALPVAPQILPAVPAAPSPTPVGKP
jgi:hypothetical protein